MQKLVVKGKKSLSGTVKISGSKNATLPILAASILSDKKIELSNYSNILDFGKSSLMAFLQLTTAFVALDIFVFVVKSRII